MVITSFKMFNICEFLMNRFKRREAWSIVSCLVLGATVYSLWQERNNRFFSKLSRSSAQLSEDIKQEVRLKIATLPWKNSHSVSMVKDRWLIA